MRKTKLKNLTDNAKFYISKEVKGVSYTLLKLDRKTKMATYQSNQSTKTFTRGWGKEVFVG